MGHTFSDRTEEELSHGREAAERLNNALRNIGLSLPAVQGSYPYQNQGLVDLGTAPAALVDKIAQWIEERS